MAFQLTGWRATSEIQVKYGFAQRQLGAVSYKIKSK